jgi:hypothetical protein
MSLREMVIDFRLKHTPTHTFCVCKDLYLSVTDAQTGIREPHALH